MWINSWRYIILIMFLSWLIKYTINLFINEFSCRNKSITCRKFIILFICTKFNIIHRKMIWTECTYINILFTFCVLRYSFSWWMNILDTWYSTNIIMLKFWIFAILSINSFRCLIDVKVWICIILINFVNLWDGCCRFHVILCRFMGFSL